MNHEIAVKTTPSAIEVLPDSDRYKCRFTVRSESSNKLYMVSYDSAAGAGYWTCSCFGNRRFGQCKHLTAAGLKGRKFGKSEITLVNVNGRLEWKK